MFWNQDLKGQNFHLQSGNKKKFYLDAKFPNLNLDVVLFFNGLSQQLCCPYSKRRFLPWCANLDFWLFVKGTNVWKTTRNLVILLNQIHFAFVKSYWDFCSVFGRHVTQHICASPCEGPFKKRNVHSMHSTLKHLHFLFSHDTHLIPNGYCKKKRKTTQGFTYDKVLVYQLYQNQAHA